MNSDSLKITIDTLEELIEITKHKEHISTTIALKQHYDNLVYLLDIAKGIAIEERKKA